VSRDGEEPWDFVTRETILYVGYHIRTGEDSKAIIGLADMSSFEMRSESHIVLSEPEARSNLRLLAGNLWMNVKRMAQGGSMEIEMNQAVAGIKGTTFELWENRKGASVLKVTEGLVSFRHKRTGQVVNVGPGHTYTATPTGMIQGGVSVTLDGPGNTLAKSGKVLDAVTAWGNGKAYFFKGSQYVRWDIKADRVDPGYPKSIREWTGLPWTDGIDTVVNWGNGKAYFFKGSQYVRWDIPADRADSGYPKPISEWAGLPWTNGIDAAANWGNGKAYFFKGSQYVRWDIAADRMDPGYPKPMSEWTGLPWTNGIDAAVNWGNGKAYFFKGSQYVRWDIAADRMDPGYPKAISEWTGLQELLR
jgi:matrix metalloproteinase-14 (membrane-inserted)